MKFILTKKLGMSQLFDPDGRVHAVTLLDAEPNVITQVRTKERDGYEAVQVGIERVVPKKISKAEGGHAQFRHLREFRVESAADYTEGDEVTVSTFEEGEEIVVSALSVGKGFQGVVKRHGFGGAPASHGHGGALRAPGSIGSAFPQRVLKGTRMGGRMGGGRVSTKNLKIIRIDPAKNILFLTGSGRPAWGRRMPPPGRRVGRRAGGGHRGRDSAR